MLFKKTTPAAPRAARRIVPRKRIHARVASSREEIDDYESESEPSMKLSQAFLVVLALHILAVGGIYGFNKLKENSSKPVAAKTEPAPAPAAPPVLEKAPEPAPAAAPVTEAASQTYTVVAGDTLRKIATKFKTSVEALEKANNLTATSIIRTGQVLVVGKAAAAAPVPVTSNPTPSVVAKPEIQKPVAQPVAEIPKPAAPESKPVAKVEPSASGKSYVVAKGDNPYSIAKKFQVTQDALMKANNIDDPRKLQIGQKLVIP
ncbi:MAG: LysM peptidoglycan-binding domain-containing protein [Verrucomicrobiota bacterium]